MTTTAFTRSAAGLANLYLFLKVDGVAFVEGGSLDLDISKIEAGECDTDTHDVKFWENVLALRHPEKNFDVRSVGSKTNLEAILCKIDVRTSPGVFICMDADASRVWGPIHQGVYYTRGYSWENELVCTEVIVETFFSVCSLSKARKEAEVRSYVDKLLLEIRTNLASYVVLDLVLLGCGESFFDRAHPSAPMIPNGASKKPVLNKAYLSQRRRSKLRDFPENFRTIKKSVLNIGLTHGEFEIQCYGHLLEKLFCLIISHLLQKFSRGQKQANDVCLSLGIEKFFQQIADGKIPAARRYYANLAVT